MFQGLWLIWHHLYLLIFETKILRFFLPFGLNINNFSSRECLFYNLLDIFILGEDREVCLEIGGVMEVISGSMCRLASEGSRNIRDFKFYKFD